MNSRREFLRGAALATVPLVTGVPGIADAKTGAISAYQAVLIDDRHAEARVFGAALARRGADVRTVPGGDVTTLWLEDIGPAWRRTPVPVAGLTRPPVLFCLEQLAWAQGLRVVFHCEHVVTRQSLTQHTVQSCPADLAPPGAGEVALRGPLWPMQVADVVSRFDATRGRERNGPSCAGLLPTVPTGAEILTSWIIAPA
jgi:hypothetical protein